MVLQGDDEIRTYPRERGLLQALQSAYSRDFRPASRGARAQSPALTQKELGRVAGKPDAYSFELNRVRFDVHRPHPQKEALPHMVRNAAQFPKLAGVEE